MKATKLYFSAMFHGQAKVSINSNPCMFDKWGLDQHDIISAVTHCTGSRGVLFYCIRHCCLRTSTVGDYKMALLGILTVFCFHILWSCISCTTSSWQGFTRFGIQSTNRDCKYNTTCAKCNKFSSHSCTVCTSKYVPRGRCSKGFVAKRWAILREHFLTQSNRTHLDSVLMAMSISVNSITFQYYSKRSRLITKTATANTNCKKKNKNKNK